MLNIAEMEYALVWHYRMADPEFSEWLANELVANMEQMLAQTELRAVRGSKSVEVRLAWANKGEFAARMLALYPDAVFRLAAGDDRTDEDMFARLPADAWTIQIGEKPSQARFRLAGWMAMRSLLEELAAAVPADPSALSLAKP